MTARFSFHATKSGRSQTAPTRSIHSERQQDIPDVRSIIPRTHIHHPADNHSRRTINRTAMTRYAVDGAELSIRVVVPQDGAVFGRIRANASIERTRKN